MKTVALGEVAEVVSGSTPKTAVPEYWGGPIPWVTPADLSGLGGVYIASTPRMLTATGVESCATRVLPAGSVLLSSRAPIGHVAINTVPMATNQGFKSLVPGRHIDAKYLYYWLRTNTSLLQSRGNGATFKELSKRAVERIEIPLPILQEQRRIAAILDKADALRAKRRKALGRMECLERAIFHEMFGGLEATSTVADITLPQKGSIRTGPFGSQLRHGEFVEDGVAVIGLDNVVGNEFTWGERRFITAEKFQQLKRYEVRPGDVLISIMGTTGRCVVAPDGIPTAITTKHLCAITPDPNQMHPAVLRASFLWHVESRQHLRRQTKGSIMDGLNMGIIKTMPVPVPPIDLQRDYVERAERFAQLRDAAGAQRHVQEALFNSLQSRAFRGEL